MPRFFLLFFILNLFLLNFAYSQSANQLKSNLDLLSTQIQILDREIEEFNKKIDQTQGEAKTLKDALAKLELRRTTLAKEIFRTRLRITQTEENINVTKDRINTTESILAKNKKALSEVLRSLVYQDDLPSSFISVLKSKTNLSDLLDTKKRSEDISNAINNKVGELATTKQVLYTQKELYESNKRTLENLNVSLNDQKVLVDQTAKDKNSLLTLTKNKETEYQKLLAERKKKKEELELEMLDVESKLKVVVDISKLPKYGKGVLKYPVENVRITQYFGNTPFASKNPQVYNGAGHNGVDFAIRSGSPILAAEAGIVLGYGDTDIACGGVSYGKWVLIRHINGLSTLYAHLSVIQVQSGQKVSSLQKIGLSGNTGYSTGPHLHFAVFAADSVHISSPTEYRSRVCGTYMVLPLAPRGGYLNPLSYL